MERVQPRISVFPKCYFDELCRGEMDYASWIRSAATLGAEGLEHYDGFFRGRTTPTSIRCSLMAETGQTSSMLCFSPDFTHPDAGGAHAAGRAAAGGHRSGGRRLGTQILPDAQRTALPGPDADAKASSARSRGSAARSNTPSSATSCCAWRTTTRTAPGSIPSSRSPRTSSSRSSTASIPHCSACSTIRRTRSSAATIRSRFWRRCMPRVVTMHASDRYLAPGATLDELRHSRRHDRLLRQAAARRNRPGPERLRRDLPHPRGRAASPAGFPSRTA